MWRRALRLLELSAGAACLLIGGTMIAGAQDMTAFLRTQALWIERSDRPQLLLSRGTVIAWIRDPFHLPKSFDNHFNKGDAPLVIVPPGTAIMAFPPRRECSSWVERILGRCPPAPGSDRGTDPRYMLALTEDGFWGVLDRDNSAYVLDENDLKPMLRAERNGAKFLMAKQQIVTVPYSFTRGEPFRVAEPSTCANIKDGQDCVNFDLASPTFETSQRRLVTAAAKEAKQSDAMQVPEEQVREIKLINTIVPSKEVDNFLDGKGGYEAILTEGAFNSLRVASSSKEQTAQCGTELIRESELNESMKAQGSAEGKAWAKGGIGVIGASTEVSAKVEAAREAATKNNVKATIRLAIEPRLWPVDLTDKNGEASSFWVGSATTCGSGRKTVATLMISDLPPLIESDARFLNKNFQQIAEQIAKADGNEHEAAPQFSALEEDSAKLVNIKPGGNPFDRSKGVIAFKCLSQALAFDEEAIGMMQAPSVAPVQVLAAIAAISVRGTHESNATLRFYRDSACGS